jgi:hypothetical protein
MPNSNHKISLIQLSYALQLFAIHKNRRSA